MNAKNLSDRIKDIRQQARLTPGQAADKVGVSRQAFMKWESGDTKNMKLGNLLTFCDSFGVKVEDLIRGINSTLQVSEPPAQYKPQTQKDKDIAEINNLLVKTNETGVAMILQTSRQIATERPEKVQQTA